MSMKIVLALLAGMLVGLLLSVPDPQASASPWKVEVLDEEGTKTAYVYNKCRVTVLPGVLIVSASHPEKFSNFQAEITNARNLAGGKMAKPSITLFYPFVSTGSGSFGTGLVPGVYTPDQDHFGKYCAEAAKVLPRKVQTLFYGFYGMR